MIIVEYENIDHSPTLSAKTLNNVYYSPWLIDSYPDSYVMII